jgi:hypothetical protein
MFTKAAGNLLAVNNPSRCLCRCGVSFVYFELKSDAIDEKESPFVLRITNAIMNKGNADLGRRDIGTFARLQNMSRCFQFYVFHTFEHHI